MTDSPIATIPLYIGGDTFAVQPRASARFIAAALSPPETESNAESIDRVVETIAKLMPSPDDAQRFRSLWGDENDPTGGLTQGELIEAWEQMVVHYTRRPTAAPSPYSSGFGTRTGGTNSTPESPSPADPASVPSAPTSDGY